MEAPRDGSVIVITGAVVGSIWRGAAYSDCRARRESGICVRAGVMSIKSPV